MVLIAFHCYEIIDRIAILISLNNNHSFCFIALSIHLDLVAHCAYNIGNHTTQIIELLGGLDAIQTNVYPVKGYAIEVPYAKGVIDSGRRPNVSLVDGILLLLL
jgi:hypothetical protein